MEMLRAIGQLHVDDRRGRVAPHAKKRRPKPQRFLMEGLESIFVFGLQPSGERLSLLGVFLAE